MTAWPDPVTLTGRHAALVPLAAGHAAALADAVRDGQLWRLWYTKVPAPEGMADEIARRLSLQAAGSMLPFAVISLDAAADAGSAPAPGAASGTALELAGGTPVGMTTYMNIDTANRRVEIGSTWVASRMQRTPLNTECKRLLLGHAFDGLDCIAVEFRTHRLNTQSRRAIERLGAQLDGILRAHQVGADGALRDTAVYSITAAEWPTVRAHLDWQLARPRA